LQALQVSRIERAILAWLSSPNFDLIQGRNVCVTCTALQSHATPLCGERRERDLAVISVVKAHPIPARHNPTRRTCVDAAGPRTLAAKPKQQPSGIARLNAADLGGTP